MYRNEGGKRLFLLVQHAKSNYWGFPKGHLEGKETAEQAALRETQEEVGITPKLIPGFIKRTSYMFSLHRGLIFKRVIYFLAEAPNDTVQLSDEIKSYIWLPFEEALKKISFRNLKKIFSSAERFLQEHKESLILNP